MVRVRVSLEGGRQAIAHPHLDVERRRDGIDGNRLAPVRLDATVAGGEAAATKCQIFIADGDCCCTLFFLK